MTPPLTIAPGELGRYVILLGAEQVGEISPCNGSPRARFQWSLWLPSLQRLVMQPAETFEEARDDLTRQIEAWSVRAGYFYPGQTIEEVAVLMSESALRRKARSR
jgi:hypothetical protein